MTLDRKLLLLGISCAGLVLLWFAPAAVWIAMPAWIAVAAALSVGARTDDWLAVPLAGLPFWWATGLAQYAIPVLAGIGVIGALYAPPISRRVRDTWNGLGAEKWLALAAFGSMLPSFLVVSGGGRMFTYTRTVGLIGVSLAAMLLARAFSTRDDPRGMIRLVVALAGAMGLWTLAQLVYKGSIHLPLQRTASLLEALPGKAGDLASRAVGEAAGIKYENIGGGRLVVRPHAFFVHAVVTGAMAGLLGPLLWSRIRHLPVWRAVVSAGFAGLIATALVSSLARGAYLGIAVALPAAVVALWPRIRRLDPRRAAPAVLLGLAVAGVVFLTRGQEAKARQDSQLAAGSFVSRAAYYKATLRKTFEYPLFGHGTQRDNLAAEIVAPPEATIVRPPAGTIEAVVDAGGTGVTFIRATPGGTVTRFRFSETGVLVATTTGGRFDPPAGPYTVEEGTETTVFGNPRTDGKHGIIVVRRLPTGIMHRLYYDVDGVQQADLVSSPERDPPLGSHSTLLGVSYKYGLVGLAAFIALWMFAGIAPLRRLRSDARPLFADARAIWIGILAFGAQYLIYEYDFDSTSPYLFYLLCGLLLGMSARAAPVEFARRAASQPARAGTGARSE